MEYGAERVFMDRSDIAPGTSFADVVGREATDSDVLLAVIGPRWLDALDPDGHRRLDAPDDVTGMPGTPFTVPGLNPGALDGRFRRVTFLEAREYCAWLYRTGRLYRVPTEAEWEKAVRGTDGRLYPWGERWDDGPAGEGDDGRGASPYGLLHAVGAGEWAWTHRRHEYPFTPTGFDDARWMAPVNAIEAAGVSVVRGGGRWDPASARCTARTFRRWAPTRPPTAHVRLALPASAVEAGG